MESVLSQLRRLRKGPLPEIDRNNSCRYRILFREADGRRRAYYFGVPIYERISRQLVVPAFAQTAGGYLLRGSNAAVTISGGVLRLENHEGAVCVQSQERTYFLHGGRLAAANTEMTPAMNGVVCKQNLIGGRTAPLTITTAQPFLDMRGNAKYFGLMRSAFTPFMTVSAIGVFNRYGRLCGPARMHYEKKDDRSYTVYFTAGAMQTGFIISEMNLYEPKLFQDTTVESKNPGENNAFGSVAFLGKSETFGEQWLYSRIDHEKLSDLWGRTILNVTLHIPRYGDSSLILTGCGIARRFCSFGSVWDNKVAMTDEISDSGINGGYHTMDLTRFMVNRNTRCLQQTDGMLLRSKSKERGFSAVATGDNYHRPQILEILYQ